MNRRFFLQFASILFPVTKLFGWKQEVPKSAALSTVGEAAINVSQILTAIEKEVQSWIGLSERQLFIKYGLPIKLTGEWAVSIQPLREAVAKRFGLPEDHILFFGVQFGPIPKDIAIIPCCDHSIAEARRHRKLQEVYNIEIYKRAPEVKTFSAYKGYWVKA